MLMKGSGNLMALKVMKFSGYPKFSEPIEFSREKKYSPGIRISYRFYYLARKLLNSEKLLTHLLDFTWLFQRIAQEQTYYLMNTLQDTGDILRPRNLTDILESTVKGQKVLDFGGGTGVVTHALLENGNSVVYLDHSQDASNSAVTKFSNNPNFALLLPEKLSDCAIKSFDLVVLSHVLEHVQNRPSLLKELRQLTRKIHIEVPDYSSDPLNYARSIFQLSVHKDDDHVVEFTIESLRSLLLEVDLTIEKIKVRDGCIVALCRCD